MNCPFKKRANVMSYCNACTLKEGSLMAPCWLNIFPMLSTVPSQPAVPIFKHFSIPLDLLSLFPPVLILTDVADTWRHTTTQQQSLINLHMKHTLLFIQSRTKLNILNILKL